MLFRSVAVLRLDGVVGMRTGFGRTLSLPTIAADIDRLFADKDVAACAIIINSPEDGILKFKKADIAKTQKGQSAMPDTMVQVLSKRDLRDLVEFLGSLK
mgnify:CR=1 FL=1